ncbi:unnamed protein product, partial [Mesorhabditis belari]|uniref:Glycosyltransferase 25 family member n=1 Tax=Mesorhabditis belari TaxID=2138241 RepID=A0AAF3J234_9BILA
MAKWKTVSLLCCTLAYFHLSIANFFQGEGDVGDLCPPITLAIEFREHAHVLPYFFGWLENVDYPKEKIYLELFINGKEDSTADQVTWWQSSVQNLFGKINLHTHVENWLEDGLRAARLRKRKRILFLTGDTLPDNEKLLRNLRKLQHIAIIPYMQSAPFRQKTNVNLTLEKGKTYEIEENEATLPLYLNLEHSDISYLTFDQGNLFIEYNGPPKPLAVFEESCRRMDVKIFVSAENYHGYWLEPQKSIQAHRWLMRYLAADWAADRGAHAQIHSRSVRPFREEPSKLGFDEIFLINLERRKDRLRRAEEIMGILGIDFQLWKATDGHNLPQDLAMHYLPGYLDPFHQRPMKAGEIGCFLSHYRIWEEIVKRGLKKTIVFEDDIRVTADGLQVLKETMEDLGKKREPWDFVYLGRKINSAEGEFFVTGHRHLSTIGYSYWTLGYMISLDGAKKLLATEPLKRLLPVDEYLPIMYNKHPNKEWASNFVGYEKLIAYATHPVVVVPQRYTFQEGYVSDTEASHIVTLQNPTPAVHNEL